MITPFKKKQRGHMGKYLSIAGIMAPVVCCLASTLRASDDFEARTYKNQDGKTLLYRMYTPEKMAARNKYPLVLFFHGAGERGNDNTKQLTHGARDILAYSRENGVPAILIVPQCPNNQQWVNTPWGADSHVMPESPSESMKLTQELLADIRAKYPVDTKRIYVTGISMGGYGTWDILQRMPKVFAAAIPICGGGDTNQASQIKNIPIWAFHGGNDTVVKTKRSRDMIAALKEAGGKPSYTEYKGVNHNSWTQTYADKTVLKWLFQQKK